MREHAYKSGKRKQKFGERRKKKPFPAFSNILPVVSGRFEKVSRSYHKVANAFA